MKKFILLMLLCILFASPLEAKQVREKNFKKSCVSSTLKEKKLSFDSKKYDDIQSYYLNINIKTPFVVSKALTIKKELLSQIKDIEIESFSASKESASLSLKLSNNDELAINSLFTNDPEVINYSRSISNIGRSYAESALNYYSYKALIDNIEEIGKLLRSKGNTYFDECMVKNTLMQQERCYKSNLDSYEKQMNKLSVHIYISESPKEKD